MCSRCGNGRTGKVHNVCRQVYRNRLLLYNGTCTNCIYDGNAAKTCSFTRSGNPEMAMAEIGSSNIVEGSRACLPTSNPLADVSFNTDYPTGTWKLFAPLDGPGAESSIFLDSLTPASLPDQGARSYPVPSSSPHTRAGIADEAMGARLGSDVPR